MKLLILHNQFVNINYIFLFLLVTYLLYQLLRLLIKVFTSSVKPARFCKPDEPIHWNDPNQKNDCFTYLTIRFRFTRCASFRNNRYVSIAITVAINSDAKSNGFNELKLFELSKMFKPMKE